MTHSWEVRGGKFDNGFNNVTMSCHHRDKGACGGCYARLVEALTLLEKDGNILANTVLNALKKEGEALK